jgi:intracellular sulfur oxidation DsrE/DsrF family protein
MIPRLAIASLGVLAFAAAPCASRAGAAPPPTFPAVEATAPPPTIDRPRRIVLSFSDRDPARVNEVIGNVGNIQRFYGADNVKIALVVYGPGVHALLKNESSVQARIAGLIAIGVEVLACGATMTSLGKTQADLIDGVRIVPNGIPEIVERQARGWIYVRP